MSYISYDQIPAYVDIVTRHEMNVNFQIATLKEKAHTRSDTSEEQVKCQEALTEFNSYVENISTRLEKLKLSDERQEYYVKMQVNRMRETVRLLEKELGEELKRIQRGM